MFERLPHPARDVCLQVERVVPVVDGELGEAEVDEVAVEKGVCLGRVALDEQRAQRHGASLIPDLLLRVHGSLLQSIVQRVVLCRAPTRRRMISSNQH